MGNARRIAERMILDRAAHAHAIAQKLREVATRLETNGTDGVATLPVRDAASELRELAEQTEKL